MAELVEFVCRRCGGPATGISQAGTARCGASRDIREVSVTEAGEIEVRWSMWDVDADDDDVDADDDDVDEEHVECMHCHADGKSASELLDHRSRVYATCTCGHALYQHPEAPYDAKVYARGTRPCSQCSCEEYEPAREGPPEVHPEQEVLAV